MHNFLTFLVELQNSLTLGISTVESKLRDLMENLFISLLESQKNLTLRISKFEPILRNLLDDLLIFPVELTDILILTICQLFSFMVDEGNKPLLKLQYFFLKVVICSLYNFLSLTYLSLFCR